MSNSPEASPLLDLLDKFPVGPAPLPVILEKGRASRRRRRAATLTAAGLLSIVAVTASAFALADENAGPPVVADAAKMTLPTGSWRPGERGFLAIIAGTLALDRNGCVVLATAAGDQYAVWPSGYTAERDSDGKFRVLDPDGKVVGRSGQSIETTGGYFEASRFDQPCLPSTGEVAVVTATVRPTSN